MTKFEAYALLGGTVLLTVVGQLLIKWQVLAAGDFPGGFAERFHFLWRVLLQPWVIAAFAFAFIAGLCWIAAMTRIALTVGYPFVSLTFPLVLVGGALFFGEAINWQKVAAIALIMAGVMVQVRA